MHEQKRKRPHQFCQRRVLGIDAVITRLPIAITRQDVIGLVPSGGKIAGGESDFHCVNAEERSHCHPHKKAASGGTGEGRELSQDFMDRFSMASRGLGPGTFRAAQRERASGTKAPMRNPYR